MDKRFIGVFVFAILVALATSVAVYKLLSSRIASSPKVETTQVNVAARDLPVGTVLKEADLREVAWGAPLPKNAIITKEELVDRAVTSNVSDGEVFTDARVAPKGGGAGLSAKIPDGKRAIGLRVDDVAGIAGFVLPGMKVDVIALADPSVGGRTVSLGTQSRTLLQNVEVLSAGQNIQRDPDGKPVTVNVVNLLVTPEEAEIVSLAGNFTRIQLVLRNPLDEKAVQTPGTAMAYLFSGQPMRAQPLNQPVAGPRRSAAPQRGAPPPPRPVVLERVTVPVTMEIISGAKRDNVKVGETVEERPASGKK